MIRFCPLCLRFLTKDMEIAKSVSDEVFGYSIIKCLECREKGIQGTPEAEKAMYKFFNAPSVTGDILRNKHQELCDKCQKCRHFDDTIFCLECSNASLMG